MRPGLNTLTATAVEGPDNDVIEVTFTKPVVMSEAETPDYYAIEHPVGNLREIPPGSTISYDPLYVTTRIVLNGNGTFELEVRSDD